MSSSKKRRELTRAQHACRDAKSRLGGAESMAHMWEAGCLKYDQELKKVILKNEQLKLENGALQAKIDELMLEYCPSEMSKEQLDNWAAHQRPVSESEQKKIDALLASIPEVGQAVKLLRSIYDHGEDHHPPGYCAHKDEIVYVREVREKSLAVSHEHVLNSSFSIYPGEYEIVNHPFKSMEVQ